MRWCGLYQGLELDYTELREYSHGMFAHVAEVLEADFEPYLATVIAAAIHSCQQVHLSAVLTRAAMSMLALCSPVGLCAHMTSSV